MPKGKLVRVQTGPTSYLKMTEEEAAKYREAQAAPAEEAVVEMHAEAAPAEVKDMAPEVKKAAKGK